MTDHDLSLAIGYCLLGLVAVKALVILVLGIGVLIADD
jgi:hypothetical protein